MVFPYCLKSTQCFFSQEDHFCNDTMSKELFMPYEQNIADTYCKFLKVVKYHIKKETFLVNEKRSVANVATCNHFRWSLLWWLQRHRLWAFLISSAEQECIPVGYVPPARYHTWGSP